MGAGPKTDLSCSAFIAKPNKMDAFLMHCRAHEMHSILPLVPVLRTVASYSGLGIPVSLSKQRSPDLIQPVQALNLEKHN